MSTTVNVVCYRNKKLSNGENLLMLRVCKDRKTKYRSLGVSVNPIYWDFEKNRPKPNCPNKDYILKIILDKERKKIRSSQSTLIAPKVKMKIETVHEFYHELIGELEQTNKIGNSRVYKDSLRSLEVFTGGKLDMPFSHIDVDFLKGYYRVRSISI